MLFPPGSNLAALVSRNVAPSDTEKASIRDLFEQKSADIAAVDDEVSKCITTLVNLIRRRDRLCQEHQLLASVLSPIWKIPAEITLEIFKYCVENSCCTPGYATTSPLQSPLLLGQICSAWRSLSQGAPRLWDRIYVSAHLEK
ncbi:hypothetical protein C8R43DRAFT_868841, partial [Mycena crocata]